MKHVILVLMICLCIDVTHLSAQETAFGWTSPTLSAAESDSLLETALMWEKSDGELDSAITVYRRILAFHRQHRVKAHTAARASARIGYLQTAGLISPDTAGLDPSGIDASAGRLRRVTERLQLGVQVIPSIQDARARADREIRLASGTVSNGPLLSRRRWLVRGLQLHAGHRVLSASGWVAQIGQGVEVVRSALGLRGVPYYVAEQLRLSREQSLTPHEQFLAALREEKEHQNIDRAIGLYREVVQLNLTGGIATRLSERAQQRLEHCQERQRAAAAGS